MTVKNHGTAWSRHGFIRNPKSSRSRHVRAVSFSQSYEICSIIYSVTQSCSVHSLSINQSTNHASLPFNHSTKQTTDVTREIPLGTKSVGTCSGSQNSKWRLSYTNQNILDTDWSTFLGRPIRIEINFDYRNN